MVEALWCEDREIASSLTLGLFQHTAEYWSAHGLVFGQRNIICRQLVGGLPEQEECSGLHRKVGSRPTYPEVEGLARHSADARSQGRTAGLGDEGSELGGK